MKMLILPSILLLTAAVPGLMLPTPSDDIPVPHLKVLTTLNTGFTIEWDPIDTTNVKDPIIGIKVKTWKTPCIIKKRYHLSDNGASMIVESVRLSYNRTTIPDILPEYVSIVKPDELTATVPHIEREQWYHIRALAFTATDEGKHSDAYDFKLGSDDEKDKEKACERIISETPCKHSYALINPRSPDTC
ncbi:uncharacterized protein LOC112050990 [Bicyclus anynana]|uniref:Uncharacterized protein LOC112050990 n=1 Tax=Bicyclus anynana TaxID=110368 RepID=A0A6J1NJL7_BICAN|nr:uncharacterized protein LOC112050990 [Bicyclus anynana]